jgi:hypothetical protein
MSNPAYYYHSCILMTEPQLPVENHLSHSLVALLLSFAHRYFYVIVDGG